MAPSRTTHTVRSGRKGAHYLTAAPSANANSTWYREEIKVVGAPVVGETEPQGVSGMGVDSTYSSGRPALYHWDSTMRFDNFRVRRAVAVEPSTTVAGEEPSN